MRVFKTRLNGVINADWFALNSNELTWITLIDHRRFRRRNIDLNARHNCTCGSIALTDLGPIERLHLVLSRNIEMVRHAGLIAILDQA